MIPRPGFAKSRQIEQEMLIRVSGKQKPVFSHAQNSPLPCFVFSAPDDGFDVTTGEVKNGSAALRGIFRTLLRNAVLP